jgi:hypothetical protein
MYICIYILYLHSVIAGFVLRQKQFLLPLYNLYKNKLVKCVFKYIIH